MRNRVWPWLAAIVVISAAVRIALGRHVIAPWIMVDELIYSELAKSFAASGHFQVRGVASNGYGFVYPALIAPAWKLFGAMPAVYGAAKAINAVVMSCAAIPAYFLARRVVTHGAALCVAVLAVAIPSMLYTSELMTENAFYPLFLVACLALVATLERPTPLRQVGVLVLCGLAFATRQQAVALVPAVAVAPALLGLIERDVKRHLRAWLTTYAILGGGAVVVLGGTIARGRSPLSLLGAYRAATSVPYSATSVLHYLLWHVAELDLYLGVIPFAALLALWLAPRHAAPFVAATLPITVLLLVEVALFASTQSARIEERNMFYVAPFGLIALLRVVPRTRWTLVAATVAGVLPVTIPFAKFVNPSAVSDTFALLPWWWVQDRGIHFGPLRLVALGAGLAAAAVFVLLPRRYLLALPVLVGAYFVVTNAVVQNGRHGIERASAASLFAGIKVPHRDWVDRAVGRSSDVTMVWVANPEPHPVYENEFFNRSIRNIDAVGKDIWTGGLPETELHERRDGVLVDPAGVAPHADAVVAPLSLSLAGKTLASDQQTGYAVVRVNGPLLVLTKVTGVYGDSWSRKRVTYVHRRCSSGYVSATLQSDRSLYSGDQVVRAGGRSISVAPDGQPHRFLVPLQAVAGNQCAATFTVAKLRVPAQVEPGSTDTRALGIRFLRFDYLP